MFAAAYALLSVPGLVEVVKQGLQPIWAVVAENSSGLPFSPVRGKS